MTNAALLRCQIESKLSSRIPAALSTRGRTEPARIPCGVLPIDALLQGGLPAGALTELVGPESSGRTTVALALLASVTQREGVCAWIDVADALDPESAAANGVDLKRLLWVRCGEQRQGSLPVAIQQTAGTIVLTSQQPAAMPLRGAGSPHPRSEGRGMPEAISAMLRAHGGLYDKQARREKRSIGTPGMPNRPLTFRSDEREEQVSYDRLPARRGERVVSARTVSQRMEQVSTELFHSDARPANKPWSSLDQALRAADLLLQAGGFSVLVLDLGGTPPEMAWRIPLATWFRFRAACERTRVSVLLLTQHPCARSSAELVVRMATGQMQAQNKVMSGIAFHAERERQRRRDEEVKVVSIRKPPQSEHEHKAQWTGTTAWANRR